MKSAIWMYLTALAICVASCDKEATIDDGNVQGLPPATQTGANTLGFLLNGVLWVPAGNNGTQNLIIGVDTGVYSGNFIIRAYSALPQNVTEFATSFPSVDFSSFPTLINPRFIGFVSFKNRDGCNRISNEPFSVGATALSISRHDKANRIISGVFESEIISQACGDTIKITKGRFDLKY